MSLPLSWRRRTPLVVLCAVVGSAVLSGVVLGNFLSWEPLVAFIAAMYSVGAHGDRRRAVAGLAVAYAALLPAELARAFARDRSVDLGFLVVLGAAWTIGRALRRWRLEAFELGNRASRLEREREQQARAAVAEERARIARELHDVVAHCVSVIVIQAQGADRALEGEQQPVREALGSIESTGRQALVEMRRLLGILRRSDEELALAPQPSVRHLGELAEQMREAGLPVELLVEGDRGPLPPGVDLSAYRIVQEALTNALKHAGPARARVLVRYAPDELELEISDDGRGSVQAAGGHGLVGMRERVAFVGGVLESGARPGGGFLVRARLPLGSGGA
jgi:signal transduction histidine kinase